MTDRERAAFRAGLQHAADMALAAAREFEARKDARKLRRRAAAEALRALAEGLTVQSTTVTSTSSAEAET